MNNSNKSDISYQKSVITRLEKQGKITSTNALMLYASVYAWKVTKLLGISIDFIADNQMWIINIGRKVHWNQTWLINIWWSVNGEQIWIINWKKKSILQKLPNELKHLAINLFHEKVISEAKVMLKKELVFCRMYKDAYNLPEWDVNSKMEYTEKKMSIDSKSDFTRIDECRTVEDMISVLQHFYAFWKLDTKKTSTFLQKELYSKWRMEEAAQEIRDTKKTNL